MGQLVSKAKSTAKSTQKSTPPTITTSKGQERLKPKQEEAKPIITAEDKNQIHSDASTLTRTSTAKTRTSTANVHKTLSLPKSPIAKRNSSVPYKDTRQLAIQLAKTTSGKEHQNQSLLAFDVINGFSLIPQKQYAQIKEVSTLALGHDTIINIALLNSFIGLVREQPLLNPHILEALAKTIRYTDPRVLEVDDLVQILRILHARLRITHIEGNDYKLHHLLHTMAFLMDAFIDSGVRGLDREELHEALYDTLNQDILKKHPNPWIASLVLYTQQSLVRIPNNEDTFQAVLRRSLKGGLGVGALAVAAVSTVFGVPGGASLLPGVYRSFREALRKDDKRKLWYDDLRYLELLYLTGNTAAVELFLDKECTNRDDLSFNWGLVHLLYDVVENDEYSLSVRQHALQYFEKLLSPEIQKDADKEKFQTEMTVAFSFYHEHPNPELRATAEAMWHRITDMPVTNTRLETAADTFIHAMQPREPVERSDEFPSQLMTAVQRQPLTEIKAELAFISEFIVDTHGGNIEHSIDEKIENYRQKRLNDKYITDELEAYVPLEGVRPNRGTAPFDLAKEVDATFLKGKKRSLLLTGHAGGGKSTFNRDLERRHWQAYHRGESVPIFIALPEIQNPKGDLLHEHFTRLGFTDAEIQVLKQKYSFLLILDGFDEIKFTEADKDNPYNLSTANHLDGWKCKVLVSCRTEFLTRFPEHTRLFAFSENNQLQADLHDEMSVVSFSEAQVKTYVHRSLELRKRKYKNESQWDETTYLKRINSIPGLRTLIETPFLLMIAMDVMPIIFIKYESMSLEDKERQVLTRKELYDKFIEHWFKREVDKLKARNDYPSDTTDERLTKYWRSFAGSLATKMKELGVTYVDYYPQKSKAGDSFDDDAATTSPWEKFFGTNPDPEKDAKNRYARRACPLHEIALRKYAFIHAELIDHFAGRVILEQSQMPVRAALPPPSGAMRKSFIATAGGAGVGKTDVKKEEVTTVPTPQEGAVVGFHYP